MWVFHKISNHNYKTIETFFKKKLILLRLAEIEFFRDEKSFYIFNSNVLIRLI